MASKTPIADASRDTLTALRESGYTGGVDQNGNRATPEAQDVLDALRDNT
jgi:hypothetical protein